MRAFWRISQRCILRDTCFDAGAWREPRGACRPRSRRETALAIFMQKLCRGARLAQNGIKLYLVC